MIARVSQEILSGIGDVALETRRARFSVEFVTALTYLYINCKPTELVDLLSRDQATCSAGRGCSLDSPFLSLERSPRTTHISYATREKASLLVRLLVVFSRAGERHCSGWSPLFLTHQLRLLMSNKWHAQFAM